MLKSTIVSVAILSTTLFAVNGCSKNDKPAAAPQPTATTTSTTPTPTPSPTPTPAPWSSVIHDVGTDMTSSDCMDPADYELTIQASGDYELDNNQADCNNSWTGRYTSSQTAKLDRLTKAVASSDRTQRDCMQSNQETPETISVKPAPLNLIAVFQAGPKVPDPNDPTSTAGHECWRGDKAAVYALEEYLYELRDSALHPESN